MFGETFRGTIAQTCGFLQEKRGFKGTLPPKKVDKSQLPNFVLGWWLEVSDFPLASTSGLNPPKFRPLVLPLNHPGTIFPKGYLF